MTTPEAWPRPWPRVSPPPTCPPSTCCCCSAPPHSAATGPWAPYPSYTPSQVGPGGGGDVFTVFRICNILKRIWILGSVHWITDSRYCSFPQKLSRFQQKNNFFCLSLTKVVQGTFTSVFKDKKCLSQKTGCNKGFSNFFLLNDGRIRILEPKNLRIRNTVDL